MHYFFMARIPGFESRLTLANFPPSDAFSTWPSSQVAHVVWSDGNSWQFRPLATIPAGQTHVVTKADLPAEIGDASPFFCIHPGELPRSAASLPRSDHMRSTPDWRGNIQIVGKGTSASYQGEYPQSMLAIERGTLLSLGPLHQQGEGFTSKLVLPNMRDNPAIEECELKFFGMRSQRLLGTAKVKRNSVSVVDLSPYPSTPSDPLCIVSSEITGIPLILTHTDDADEMSFEHTHPPITMTLFGDRLQYQRHMKSWFIGRIG